MSVSPGKPPEQCVRAGTTAFTLKRTMFTPRTTNIKTTVVSETVQTKGGYGKFITYRNMFLFHY